MPSSPIALHKEERADRQGAFFILSLVALLSVLTLAVDYMLRILQLKGFVIG